MRILIVLFAFMATAQAQGVSYTGLCNPTWDCKAVKATWKGQDTIITGWLEQSFGRACKCADELLRSPKDKVIRVHFINSPCLRNRRCGPQEVLAGETVESASRKVVRRNSRIIRKYLAVVKRFKRRLEQSKGNLQCYVSACLECDLSGAARRVLNSFLPRYLPGCNIVDNPLRKKCLPNTICEKHGSNPKLSAPCIADLDGEDGKEVDLKQYYRQTRQCDIRFYWEPKLNCLDPSLRFQDPIERNCRTNKSELYRIGKKTCCSLSHPLSDIC